VEDHLIILSHYHTRPLFLAKETGKPVAQVSPDLGLTTVQVELDAAGARFPSGALLGWEAAEEISASINNCFILRGQDIEKIVIYSRLTDRVYTLMPTSSAPTMLISGIPMHRIKDTEPYQDTLEKIKTIKPVVGEVLDTATGLGYTAIEASRTAGHVTTIELDPSALEIARLNPWSRGLFFNPKIKQLIGDSSEQVEGFKDEMFTRIIHDPPAFTLAGELYSSEFYAQLYRILRPAGRLFHYIGNPESKSGHSITGGVVRRLKGAGFRQVELRPKAFGVVALKEKL